MRTVALVVERPGPSQTAPGTDVIPIHVTRQHNKTFAALKQTAFDAYGTNRVNKCRQIAGDQRFESGFDLGSVARQLLEQDLRCGNHNAGMPERPFADQAPRLRLGGLLDKRLDVMRTAAGQCFGWIERVAGDDITELRFRARGTHPECNDGAFAGGERSGTPERVAKRSWESNGQVDVHRTDGSRWASAARDFL